MRLSASVRKLLERATDKYEKDLDGKALSFLTSHAISEEAARLARLGVVASPLAGHEMFEGRLAIPYLTKTGVVNIKFRCLEHEDCKTVGCPKYLKVTGVEDHLYNVPSFFTAKNEIGVTEGELDALCLTYEVGVPGVGSPGANNWSGYYDRLFHGYEFVWIFGDGDTAGREFAKDLLGRLPNGVAVPVPAGHDLSSWTAKDGWEAVTDVLEELRGE